MPEKRIVGPDGLPTTDVRDHRLNKAVLSTFGSDEQGQAVLSYLRSITVETASGPDNINRDALLHREGARWLVGIIQMRMELGRQNLPRIE